MKFYQSHSIKTQKDFMENNIRNAWVGGSTPLGGSKFFIRRTMQSAISKTNIKSFQKTFKRNSTLRVSRNAITRSSVLDVAMNWDAFSQVDHTYSHKITNEMKKVTNQSPVVDAGVSLV